MKSVLLPVLSPLSWSILFPKYFTLSLRKENEPMSSPNIYFAVYGDEWAIVFPKSFPLPFTGRISHCLPQIFNFAVQLEAWAIISLKSFPLTFMGRNWLLPSPNPSIRNSWREMGHCFSQLFFFIVQGEAWVITLPPFFVWAFSMWYA